MARRNEHTREELQQLALRATRDFLLHYPPHELSLRKIARLIGYSPATVINSFGSYGQLLLAANADTLDEVHYLSRMAVKDETNPQQAMRKLARIYLGYARKYPHRWRLAFEHKVTDKDYVPEWQQQRINRLFALFTEQLSRCAAGKRSLQDIHIASRVIWAGVHGICLLSTEGGVVSEKNSSGEQMLDSLLSNYLSHWLGVARELSTGS